jgi:hypothetical protein
MFEALIERLNSWWPGPEPVIFFEQYESIIINHGIHFLGVAYWGNRRELLIMVPSSDIGVTVAVYMKRLCASSLPPVDVRSIYSSVTPPLPYPSSSDH